MLYNLKILIIFIYHWYFTKALIVLLDITIRLKINFIKFDKDILNLNL